MSNFRLLCRRRTLVRRQWTRGHTPRWMLYGGLLMTKRIIRYLPSTAKYFYSLPVSSTGARSSAPSGPRPANHGRSQGRVPPQSLSWKTGSIHHSIDMLIDDSSDLWLDHTSNCGALEEHHAEVFAVSPRLAQTALPLERPPFTSR